MAGPAIPYITLPEIPLGFLTLIPDPVMGAIIGLVAGGVAGSILAAPVQKASIRNGIIAGLAVLGALIGYGQAPHLFDAARPPSIKPFGTLVALGVYLGSVVATRHAKERGFDVKKMGEFIFYVVGIGFVGGHVFDAIFYHPDRVMRDPLYLLKLWDGLSSYGGFTGAIIGALIWKVYRGAKILPYCEMVNSAFPLAWVFGRAGCSVAHDHPGKHSDAWFAVRYPFGDSYVGRYDLGLYEFVLTIPLAIAFAVLWRRNPRRPIGFYTGVMCVAYAPVRFLLDFLRAPEGSVADSDPRYGGLTPAQWASFALLAMGLYFLRIAARREAEPALVEATSGASPRDGAELADEEEDVEEDDEAEEDGDPSAAGAGGRARARRAVPEPRPPKAVARKTKPKTKKKRAAEPPA